MTRGPHDGAPEHPDDQRSRGPSRRSVLRAAGTVAWTVPAVVAVSAAPALAASGLPTLAAAWVDDSFRCDYTSFASGTPESNGYYGMLAVALTVAGGTVDQVQCVLTTTGSVSLWTASTSAGQVPKRGSTTWAAGGGTQSLALDGWTSSVANGVQFQTATFTRATTTGTVLIRPVLEALSDLVPNTDFPFTLTFSSTGASSTAQILVNNSTSSPYITGTAL